MSQSPYESAPQAPPGPPPGGPSGPRAGFWIRFAGYLIDTILIAVVLVILAQVSQVIYIVGAIASIFYWVILVGSSRGQTVGMMAVGIRVYDLKEGGSIGYGRSFVRYLVMIVSSIPIYLGFFWMLWDRENQTWFDKAAGSVVVPVDAYR